MQQQVLVPRAFAGNLALVLNPLNNLYLRRLLLNRRRHATLNQDRFARANSAQLRDRQLLNNRVRLFIRSNRHFRHRHPFPNQFDISAVCGAAARQFCSLGLTIGELGFYEA